MSLPVTIAWRYLKSKKSHNAVNIISIVATLGVVVTTAAIVIVLSVFNGFNDMVQSRLSRLSTDLVISPVSGKVIENADSLLAEVTATDGVAAACPVIEDQALAVYVDYQKPVRLKGVPDDYNRYTAIDSVIVPGAGRWMLVDDVARYAVVGAGPAIDLHLQAGALRMLILYAPMRQGRVNIANPVDAFVADSLFIAAIFQAQQSAVDDDLIFVPLDFARDLFDYSDEASAIELNVSPGRRVDDVMRTLADKLGDGYTVKNRLMQQAESYRMINVEKWVTFLLLAFILLIATFNVISTLSLLIVEKRESIDTLRYLGASRALTTRIFVAQSWLITAVGALGGMVLGVLLSLGQQQFGWIKLAGDPSRLIVVAYPVKVIWTDLLIVAALIAAIAALTGLVTALIARRAA